MPAALTAATGMDALTHAIEGYITLGAWELSDMFHLKAIEIIARSLRGAVANTAEGRADMALGQYVAGMGFSNVGLGIVHSMAHPLGALYDTPHGVANAILMPTVMEFNAIADNGRYEKIFNYIRTGKGPVTNFEPMMLVEEVKKLNKDLGIPEGLRAVGVDSDEHFQAMAEDAMKAGNTLVNPRQTTVKDFVAMYYKAM
jgi:lactaldehyde reductase